MTQPGRARRPIAERASFRVLQAAFAVANPVLRPLLGAGLAGPLARAVALLEFRGRRTGRLFRTPVSYARDGSTVMVVTSKAHGWWRNVEAGADVRLRLADGWREAWAEAIVPIDPRFAPLAHAYASLRGARSLRAFGIDVDDHGRIRSDDVDASALIVLCLLEAHPTGS